SVSYDTGEPGSDAVNDPSEHATHQVPRRYRQLQVGFFLVATHVGVLLLLCTMRQRNGYRGLHEFISGTRTVRLTMPPRAARVRLTSLEPVIPVNEESVAELPRRLGPYEVQGVLPDANGDDLLIGEDVALGRRVLLVRGSKAADGLS